MQQLTTCYNLLSQNIAFHNSYLNILVSKKQHSSEHAQQQRASAAQQQARTAAAQHSSNAAAAQHSSRRSSTT
jgi:hypothetical protein